jgi:hypothetical protein
MQPARAFRAPLLDPESAPPVRDSFFTDAEPVLDRNGRFGADRAQQLVIDQQS